MDSEAILELCHELWLRATAHFVLLGPNYTMKKTCLSCDAFHFDESYDPGDPVHNEKKHVFFPIGVEGKANFFSSAISGICHFGPNLILALL